MANRGTISAVIIHGKDRIDKGHFLQRCDLNHVAIGSTILVVNDVLEPAIDASVVISAILSMAERLARGEIVTSDERREISSTFSQYMIASSGNGLTSQQSETMCQCCDHCRSVRNGGGNGSR